MLQIEQPPQGTSSELKAYLERMWQQVNIQLGMVHLFSVRKLYPDKPKIGGVYYFEDAIPLTDITGEGLWLYKSTGWIQLG